MNKNDKFHGISPEMNPTIELNDDELDSVSGGGKLDIDKKHLQAFWDIGGSGIPTCMQPLHGGEQVAMKSYWENGKVHLECTECGYIKVV